MKRFSFSLLFVTAVVLAACGALPASGAGVTPPAPTPPPIVSHGSDVIDYASLLDELRRVGAAVEPNGEVEQPFFSVKGQVIKVNSYDVQVFEYSSTEEAEAQAALVALNGSSIGTSMVTWMDTPNFFKAGQIIVLYVGHEALTLDHLMQALGLQFAGGPFASQESASDGEVVIGGGMPLPAADAAVKALAAARGIAAEHITVVSAERVEWPDACLGVTQADQTCAAKRVVTPGYRLILQVGADAERVEYHTDEFGAALALVP